MLLPFMFLLLRIIIFIFALRSHRLLVLLLCACGIGCRIRKGGATVVDDELLLFAVFDVFLLVYLPLIENVL